MEINIDNAFPMSIRLSTEPFLPIYGTATELIHNKALRLTKLLLEKPYLGTFLTLSTIVILTLIFIKSLIVMAGVVCIAVTIVMLEGLLFLILSVVSILNLSLFLLVFLILYKQ